LISDDFMASRLGLGRVRSSQRSCSDGMPPQRRRHTLTLTDGVVGDLKIEDVARVTRREEGRGPNATSLRKDLIDLRGFDI